MKQIVCIASDPAIDKFLNPLSSIGNLTIYHKQNLHEDEVVELASNAEILITGPEVVKNFTRSLIDRLPHLRLLSLLTIGYSWVDVSYAVSKKIIVSNIKGATAESVAEHTWAMILGLAKRVNEFDRETRFLGGYDFSLYKGKEVYGKTIGIVGLGDIGRKVARIAKAFNMNIIGINKSGISVDDIKLVDKQTLIREADIIALCLTLSKETESYIGEKEINQMKQGVILVNCAREKLVDKNAVLQGLETGKIFGYGVEEAIMQPISKQDPYYSFSNIIVTPHNAFNTFEADERSYKMVIKNVASFLNGKPQNIIKG